MKAIEAWIALAGVRAGEAVLRRIHKGDIIGGRLHPQSVSKIVKARIAAQHERLGAPESKALEDMLRATQATACASDSQSRPLKVAPTSARSHQ